MADAGKSYRILVVDDDEDVVFLLENALGMQGWTVYSACDGQDCIEKTKELLPDLIVMDVMMPRMDGYHACFFLKKSPSCKDIPIIMATARIQDFEETKGRMVGADAYFRKPYEINDLVDKIEEILSAKRAESTAS
jgi:CheY-like chemotaxis protein